MNQKQRQSRRRRQRGGCQITLSPAPVGGGKRRRRSRSQKKSKKGGVSGSLAALGLLGTLLAVGSRKHKSHKRRGTKKGMRRKTARRAYSKRK